MNLAELVGGPTQYVRNQGEGICFDLSANPQSLLCCLCSTSDSLLALLQQFLRPESRTQLYQGLGEGDNT
jgi:hypothetical protein